MSTQSRNSILARLRKSLGEQQPVSVNDDRGQARRVTWDKEQRVEHFIKLMTAVKTEVVKTTETAWPEQLQQLLSEKGIKQLLVSTEKETGKRFSGVESDVVIRAVPVSPEEIKDDLFFDIEASLTTCRSAIAETGTLVLWPDPAEPRTMSLVPPVHIVLLRASTIHNTLSDVIHSEGWAGEMPTNALLISGPSKTADIARILAYGAHGPRDLVVLLVED